MFLKPAIPFSSLAENLQELSYDEIQEMVYDNIFSRAKRYYRDGHVFNLNQVDENKILADVEGSDYSPYRVRVYLKQNDLRASCSCPYDDVCKHIVAVLLKLNQEKDFFDEVSISNSPVSKEKIFKEYLEELSKKELIELSMKFAPATFKEEIVLKSANEEELGERINEIASSIQFDLNDEELLYQPKAFLESIQVYLQQLSIAINSNTDEVLDLIFYLVNELEEKYDNGYLCQYHYGHEEYFDFEELSRQIIGLINHIQDISKQVEVAVRFIEFNKHTSYMGIDYKYFEIKDKKLLKSFLHRVGSFDFYLYVKEALSFEEEEHFLRMYGHKSAIFRLVDLYIQNEKKALAVVFLEELLQKEFDVRYVEKLISLKKVSQQELEQFVVDAIQSHDRESFVFIVKHIKKSESQKQLEQLFKERSVDLYYKYLEQEQRIDEMFGLLEKVPFYKENFFINYKEHYPSEAIDFFNAQIEKELGYTGDKYYQIIADALAHLKVFMSQSDFKEKIECLQEDYKRRRNFIKILNKRFA